MTAFFLRHIFTLEFNYCLTVLNIDMFLRRRQRL